MDDNQMLRKANPFPADSELRHLYDEALQLIKGNQLSNCIQLLDKILAFSPQAEQRLLAWVYLLKAEVYDQMKLSSKTMKFVDKAVQLQQGSPDKYYFLYRKGILLGKMRADSQYTISILNESVQLNPQHLPTHLELVNVLQSNQIDLNSQALIGQLTIIINLTNDSQWYLKRSKVYQTNRRYSKSLADLKKYCELNPTTKSPQNQRIKQLQQLLKIQEKRAKLDNNISNCMQQSNKLMGSMMKKSLARHHTVVDLHQKENQVVVSRRPLLASVEVDADQANQKGKEKGRCCLIY